MNPLLSLFYCLIARSRRKRGNRQTDGTLTYKPSTVTLAAHKHRGLTSVCNLMRVCVCNVVVMSPLHDERRHQSLFPGHPPTTHEPISWSNTNTYSGYIHYTYLSTKYKNTSTEWNPFNQDTNGRAEIAEVLYVCTIIGIVFSCSKLQRPPSAADDGGIALASWLSSTLVMLHTVVGA